MKLGFSFLPSQHFIGWGFSLPSYLTLYLNNPNKLPTAPGTLTVEFKRPTNMDMKNLPAPVLNEYHWHLSLREQESSKEPGGQLGSEFHSPFPLSVMFWAPRATCHPRVSDLPTATCLLLSRRRDPARQILYSHKYYSGMSGREEEESRGCLLHSPCVHLVFPQHWLTPERSPWDMLWSMSPFCNFIFWPDDVWLTVFPQLESAHMFLSVWPLPVMSMPT